jgi:hypothetical protein
VAFSWPSKDPGETLDYTINWAAPLGTDTITNSVWAVSDTSLVETDSSMTATTATVWLSAGTLNQTYSVKNTITTAAGRVFDQTVNIKIASN